MDFDGNSNISKETKSGVDNQEKKDVKPITDKVKVKKDSELRKFTRQFFSEDIKGVKGHILSYVIVPSIQKLLSDLIRSTVDGIIYGIRGVKPESTGIKNIYNYNKLGTSYFGGGIPLNQVGQDQYSRPTNYSVNNVEFADRGDAEEVLYSLRDAIDRYGVVSIGDFYDMISQKHTHTDLKYGWRDLKDADIIRVRSGFQIRFPKIIPLD